MSLATADVFAEPTRAARRPSGLPTAGAPRLVHYSHDTYGLGHLRRTLKIAGQLRRQWPDAAQLIVTGSPVAERFTLPEGTDYIKLPSVVKVGRDRYVSRSLPLDLDVIRDLRAEILAQTVDRLRPDAFLVDHAPAGMGGEARKALRMLKERSPATKLVIGLRDIVDDPAEVRRAWRRSAIYDLLDDTYDLILVYGDPGVCDVVREYGLSDRAAAKVRYVGYLRQRPSGPLGADVRVGLGMQTGQLVVMTVGGGGDGAALLEALAHGADANRGLPFDCLVVSGPLMSDQQRRSLAEACGRHPEIHFREFVDDLPTYLSAADAIVSMAGYNTVCETLDSGRPTLLVPRCEPRREQLIRADALVRAGLVRRLHPDQLTPGRLLAEIIRLLEEPVSVFRRPPLMADGLAGMAAQLSRLIGPRPSVQAGVER